MGRMLTWATRYGAFSQVRHVTPVRPTAASGLVARVYAQMTRDFGMLAPPVLLHSPAPGPLAASWLLVRESLVATGAVSRAVKERLAAEVSAENACPYCVGVHGVVSRGLGGPVPARTAAAASPSSAPSAPSALWAPYAPYAPYAPSAASPLSVPVAPVAPSPPARPAAGEAAELAAVTFTFDYLNRMVNVFLAEEPLPPEVPPRARRPALWLLGTIMTMLARRTAVPGAGLDVLPAGAEGDLTDGERAWTGGAPHFAAALAAAVALVEGAGRRSVPPAVRDLVTARLAAWDGRPPGPSRSWAAEAVAGLPPGDRPGGRLALLVAMASYQVDDAVVADFRAVTPGDRELVELASWASLAAARRIAARRESMSGDVRESSSTHR
jgi:AhpD family alkylhydroperoxidase